MRTWYEGHDKTYKKKKENGWPGWEERQKDVDENISLLEKILKY